MKSIKKKKKLFEKKCFLLDWYQKKSGSFLSLSSRKKMTKSSQITHTNPITNLCVSLLQPLQEDLQLLYLFLFYWQILSNKSSFKIKPTWNQSKKKNFLKKKCFLLDWNQKKSGFFFVTFFSLQDKKMTRTSQITHTNPITNLSLSLAIFAVNFSHQTTISNGFFAG